MAVTATQLRETLSNPPQDARARKDLYNAALEAVFALESQQDTAQRLYHGHVPLALAQTGIDLKLFETISQDKAWTLDHLALATNCDPVLLFRIARCLASYGMLKENDDGTFSASNITHNLSSPGTSAGIKHYSLTMTPAYNAIPKYLAKEGYQNPSKSAPFNLAYNTDMPVFEWRKHNPENAKAGQQFMSLQRMGQRSVWDGRVPMQDFQLSAEDKKADRAVFCDVGGGIGHQCMDLRKHNPDIQGRFITQDLPLVNDMITNKDELAQMNIETMPHNFMEGNPVKNAKVYYLRNVIHNWQDEPSKVILSHVRNAMANDSIVIIDDVVMPKTHATWKQTSMDIAMMTMLAAVERTADHFSRLLSEVGLSIRDIWTYDDEFGDSFIVAVPA